MGASSDGKATGIQEAMNDYYAVAAANIREARIRRGFAARFADKCHAALFVVIERRGLTLFESTFKDIADEAFEILKLDGIMGLLFNGVLQWALRTLVPVVVQWLRDAIQEWIDANSPAIAATTVVGAFEDMGPMFIEARKVLGWA